MYMKRKWFENINFVATVKMSFSYSWKFENLRT